MRWLRFTASGRTVYGIVEDDHVLEVSGDPFKGYETTTRRHALGSVRIELPVIPPTFYCVGFNYPKHVIEMARKVGREPDLPTQPDVGYRANNALIAHGDPVIIPRTATEQVQYEGEIVVVIGKKAKHLSEAEALSCVLGYTIGNDVSERTWQKTDKTLWRAKNTDTFKPMGPWIETDVDLDACETIIHVNGRESERFATNAMHFGIAKFISTITTVTTLHPGDVIWMGTDGHSPNLKAGDVVDITITGIGTLSNPFVAEAAA
jgi:2-keto-4-pentenoate hydratase/2-oxohepta-3-ene-1,7-dioic acid hydratase in catechol pathway